LIKIVSLLLCLIGFIDLDFDLLRKSREVSTERGGVASLIFNIWDLVLSSQHRMFDNGVIR